MEGNSFITIEAVDQRSSDGRKRQEPANQSECKKKNQQSKARHVETIQVVIAEARREVKQNFLHEP